MKTAQDEWEDEEILMNAEAEVSHRVHLLWEAARLTGTDRNKEYGEPFWNLNDCAMMVSAYLIGKYHGATVDPMQFQLTPEDIAWINVLQKIARTFNGKVKDDTYIDAAAYAAIAGECAKLEAEE